MAIPPAVHFTLTLVVIWLFFLVVAFVLSFFYLYLRSRQQSRSDLGEPVYVSCDLSRIGFLKHYVLVVRDHKYELRKDDESGRYFINIMPFDITREHMTRNPRWEPFSLRFGKYRHTYGHRLFGWTSFLDSDIAAVCEQHAERAVQYNLFTNNCQTFARTVGKVITVDDEHRARWLPYMAFSKGDGTMMTNVDMPSVFAKHPFKCLIYGVDSLNTTSLAEDSGGRSVELNDPETVRANLPTMSTPHL